MGKLKLFESGVPSAKLLESGLERRTARQFDFNGSDSVCSRIGA
jgi:hypothetical protein